VGRRAAGPPAPSFGVDTMTKNRARRAALLLLLSLSVSLSALGQEPWILGFLDNGVNLWQIMSAAVLADGSAVILLLPPPPSLTEAEPYLLVGFDAHGNRRWARQLPNASLVESEATSLLALQDGTFLLFLHAEGTIPPDCGLNVWGSRWTAEGEVLWQRYLMLYDIWWSLEAFQVPSGRVFLTSGGGELQELDVETGEALWEKAFWVVPPDGWAAALTIRDVVERADRGLTLWTGFSWEHGPWDAPCALLFLGPDGSLQGHRDFYQVRPWQVLVGRMQVAPDGGYFATGVSRYWPEEEPYPLRHLPAAVKFGPAGEIEWQYIYGNEDWKGTVYGSTVVDGTLLISGSVGREPFDGYNALLAKVGADGSLFDARVFGWHNDQGPAQTCTLREVWARPGGGLLGVGNYSPSPLGARQAVALYSFGPEGDLPESCTTWVDYPGMYGESPLAEYPVPIFTADSSGIQTCPTDASFENLIDIGADTQFCGEAYPGIVSVKKLKDPFRLKVTGWNFEEGSKLLINGTAVPKSVFKGLDLPGRTRLVASGGGLKALLPKGEAVTLTVLNPDGRESVGFRFTR